MIGNPEETNARPPSTSHGTKGLGVGTAICSLVLFLSAAVLATPLAYGDDAQAPGAASEEIRVEPQQEHSKSMQTSPDASYPDMKQRTEGQSTRLLDGAIEEWPVQALDLGLCDGS